MMENPGRVGTSDSHHGKARSHDKGQSRKDVIQEATEAS
jgi:hypothetical protein